MNTKIMPVTIRLTWKEKDQLIKAATQENSNMSEYIRKHIPVIKGGKK